MSEKKVRAKCNRTLTVSESEIPQLEQFILSANDIKNKFIDDCVINADLFECLDYIPDEYFNLIIIDLHIISIKTFMVRSFRR